MPMFTRVNIDLNMVFKHPLKPVSPALAHLDGSLNKTEKDKLLHKLDECTEDESPPETDILIVDAIFF